MPNNVKHFAVHADDVDRARKFYESVLGWQFTPWGPPNFYLIRTGTDEDPGVQGALQGRRDVVPGKPMFGYECSIGVDSVDDTMRRLKPTAARSSCPSFIFQPSARSSSSKTQKGTWLARCNTKKNTQPDQIDSAQCRTSSDSSFGANYCAGKRGR